MKGRHSLKKTIVAMPSPEVLPKSGIEPRPPALQEDCLPSEPPGSPRFMRSQ